MVSKPAPFPPRTSILNETAFRTFLEQLRVYVNSIVSFNTITTDSGSVSAADSTTTLNILGGEGVDTSISGSNLYIACENATSSNRGIASFSIDDFQVTSGAVSLLDSGVDHDATSNFDANEHVDHTAVDLTAGEGISGGGDISASRTFSLDLNELTTEVTIASGDKIPFTDIDDSNANKNLTFANLESILNHDSLSGFVSAEHIDWTSTSSNFSTSGTVDCTGTEAIKIPVGTTGQRPGTPLDGDLRVNSSTGTTEVYRNSAWRDLEAGGGLVKLSQSTASASSSIEFTGLSTTYRDFLVIFSDVAPGTDSSWLVLRTSTDNGSTYDSGASDYYYAFRQVSTATDSTVSSAAATYIGIQPVMGSATNESGSGWVKIHNPRGTQFTHVTFLSGGTDDAGLERYCMGGGNRQSAADVDAIQFLMSAGNIASGTFTLYGVSD